MNSRICEHFASNPQITGGLCQCGGDIEQDRCCWHHVRVGTYCVASKEGLDRASLKKGMRTMNQKASGKLERPRGEHALGICWGHVSEAVAMSATRLPCLQAAVEFMAWVSSPLVQQVPYQTAGFEPAI